jgi:hypothetical protein
VADRLGHSDPALTLRVYAHAMREEETDLSFAEFGGSERLYPAPTESDRRKVARREALDEDETLERLRRVTIERMETGDPAFCKMALDGVWPAKLELSAETDRVIEFRWEGRNGE